MQNTRWQTSHQAPALAKCSAKSAASTSAQARWRLHWLHLPTLLRKPRSGPQEHFFSRVRFLLRAPPPALPGFAPSCRKQIKQLNLINGGFWQWANSTPSAQGYSGQKCCTWHRPKNQLKYLAHTEQTSNSFDIMFWYLMGSKFLENLQSKPFVKPCETSCVEAGNQAFETMQVGHFVL